MKKKDVYHNKFSIITSWEDQLFLKEMLSIKDELYNNNTVNEKHFKIL
jgi:hypothetical protein